MIIKKLQQAEAEIRQKRDEIIEKLVDFSKTDALLYWDTRPDLQKRQAEVWGPILDWAKQEINCRYDKTDNLQVPEQKNNEVENFRRFLRGLTDKELAAFWLASLNMRSELLAAALVKGKIDADTAFAAANLEELWQNESWGEDEAAVKARKSLLTELQEIGAYLKS